MSSFTWANLRTDSFKTTVLVNLAGTVERMDEQILPALYSFVGRSFNASPSQLGTLTLCRALVQALSSPIGGVCGTSPGSYNSVTVKAAKLIATNSWAMHTSNRSSQSCKQLSVSVSTPSQFWHQIAHVHP